MAGVYVRLHDSTGLRDIVTCVPGWFPIRMGPCMMLNWQEAIVAVIVGGAVVSLYRHLRGMFATSQTSGDVSCHGCDDCGDDAASRVSDNSVTHVSR